MTGYCPDGGLVPPLITGRWICCQLLALHLLPKTPLSSRPPSLSLLYEICLFRWFASFSKAIFTATHFFALPVHFNRNHLKVHLRSQTDLGLESIVFFDSPLHSRCLTAGAEIATSIFAVPWAMLHRPRSALQCRTEFGWLMTSSLRGISMENLRQFPL